jgi:hypothetical protein
MSKLLTDVVMRWARHESYNNRRLVIVYLTMVSTFFTNFFNTKSATLEPVIGSGVIAKGAQPARIVAFLYIYFHSCPLQLGGEYY